MLSLRGKLEERLIQACCGRGWERSSHGIDPYTAEAALEGTNHQTNAEWWGSLNFGDIEACARSAIDQHALAAHAWLLKMKSREAAKLFRDRSVDFLHQDANHSEETSCEEVILWSPKMKSGGIWVFDDSHWPSTQKAQKILLALDYTMLEDHKSWRVYKAPDFATAESLVAPPEPTTPLGPTGPWQDEPKRGPTGPSATFPPIPDPPPTPVPPP